MSLDPLHAALCAAVGLEPPDEAEKGVEYRKRYPGTQPVALNSDALLHTLAGALGIPVEQERPYPSPLLDLSNWTATPQETA